MKENPNGCQGDIVTKDTKGSITLHVPATSRDELELSKELVSCSLDVPPEYSDHPRELWCICEMELS
jgi:hypothetical protein